jgi:hypothetical protein
VPGNISARSVPPVEHELDLEIGQDRATARRKRSNAVEHFEVVPASSLTSDAVTGRINERAIQADLPLLVVFDRASPLAREMLRERAISYASRAGELYLVTPTLLVDRPAPRGRPKQQHEVSQPLESVSPFSRRASRSARWLLLHPGDEPSVGELATATGLSRPFASQVVRALADRAVVDVVADEKDSRVRRAKVRTPAALLDAWAEVWRTQRYRQLTWDIGTQGIEETVSAWSRAARHAPRLRWALGGLAGAERVVRAAEPADVVVWVDPADLDEWAEVLTPEQVRLGRAPLRLALAPDPWSLSQASERRNARVADYAQLYLDCEREGERALEAAAAIRRERDW